ncbi:MAG: hypothetical protein KJN93_06955, partial [Alphaproteobacteria bacterium]|nr:hypothetical protein [Alphaproteobacteria bacterium]
MIGRKTVLGVSLTPAGAEAALVRGRGARRVPKVLASAVSKTPIADFDPPDSAGMARAFREIAARLPRQARRADV